MERKTAKHIDGVKRIAKKRKTDPQQLKYQQKSLTSIKTVQKSVTQILDMICTATNEEIKLNSLTINLLERSFQKLSLLLKQMYPDQHEDKSDLLRNDQEPKKVQYDPICGFNKLVTNFNRIEPQIPKSNKLNPHYSMNNIRKKSTLKMQFNRQKLIPLFQYNNSDELIEDILRQRLFHDDRNIYRYSVMMQQGKTKIFQRTENINTQEYIYGYNGQKQLLNCSMNKNTTQEYGNGILKPIFKVTNESIKNNEKPKIIRSTHKDSTFILNMKKKDRLSHQNKYTMKNVLSETNSIHEKSIKKILQSEIKGYQQSNIKWRQKQQKQRKSKIM